MKTLAWRHGDAGTGFTEKISASVSGVLAAGLALLGNLFGSIDQKQGLEKTPLAPENGGLGWMQTAAHPSATTQGGCHVSRFDEVGFITNDTTNLEAGTAKTHVTANGGHAPRATNATGSGESGDLLQEAPWRAVPTTLLSAKNATIGATARC